MFQVRNPNCMEDRWVQWERFLITTFPSLWKHSQTYQQLQVTSLESFDDRWQERTKNRMLRGLQSRVSGFYQYLHLIFGSSSLPPPALPSDDVLHQAGRLFQLLREREGAGPKGEEPKGAESKGEELKEAGTDNVGENGEGVKEDGDEEEHTGDLQQGHEEELKQEEHQETELQEMRRQEALLVEAHDILRNCSDLTQLLDVTNGRGYNLLQVAVEKNDADFLDLFVLEGCDLNHGKCSVPLHLACHLGNLPLVEYLLNCGADLTLEKGMCHPKPHAAIRHVPSRFHFLETDIFACDSNHQLPIMYAIKQDHVEIVKLLLAGSKGPDTNWPYHRLPLHHAAEHGAWETLQYLLKIKPSEVNTLSDEGSTPVLYAVKYGKKFVEYFVEAGADLNMRTMKRQTPLHLLFQELQDPLELYDTTRFLLSAGLEQDINVVDNRGNSALHELLSLVNRKVTSFGKPRDSSVQAEFDAQVTASLRLLLSNNSDPNMVNGSGLMILHKLILLLDYVTSNESGSIGLESLPPRDSYKIDFSFLHSVMHLLLEHRTDVNGATSAGRTPLVLLLQSMLDVDPARVVEHRAGYISCVELLSEHGGGPSRSSPTHCAVVTTLTRIALKCLRQRDPTLKARMSTLVRDLLVVLVTNGLDSNHCSVVVKQASGNVLTEMVKLCGQIRERSDLDHIYNWVLTAIQLGANPDIEPYPSDAVIVHSQSSIFLKTKGAQPVHHYMYQIQDFNQLFEGGHAENLLMLFYNSMDHQPLYHCLCSAKVMSRFDPNRTPSYSFIKLVSGLASQPRSLQQMARVAIYKALNRQLKTGVPKLPLPPMMRSYLLNVE